MKRSVSRLMPIVFAGMFLFASCATHNVVKKDESIVPSAAKPAVIAPSVATKAEAKPAAAVNAKPSTLAVNKQKKSQDTGVTAATRNLQSSLEKIYFDFDSSALSTSARQTLSKDFAVLKQNPQSKIRVEGHCDERGSAEYNLALGERRAKAAVTYLTTMGLPSGQLSTISYGKEKPADPGHDEAAWAKNRRDEFVLSK